MQNKKAYTIIAAIAIIFVAAVVIALIAFPPAPAKPVDATRLAQCLSGKGWTMYGTGWCSHCNNTKAEFGQAFKYVNFVDCDFEPTKCSNAGVQGYPTWSNGQQKIMGEKTLQEMASQTGCTQ